MTILRVVIVVGTLLIAGCSSQTFLAESPSMEPTIARGSKVRVDLSAYRSAAPARFDIVVFRPPINKEHVFMFRVLALPGEHLYLGESQVVIDGKVVPAPTNITYSSLASGHPAAYNNITLGKDEYFLVGDNVAGANDSRFLGPIHVQAVMGKVVKIIPAR